MAEFARRGNILVQGDPGFGDLQTQDFRFSPRSPAAKFSFDRIPFEKMGLVKDDYRRALPSTVYAGALAALPLASNVSLSSRMALEDSTSVTPSVWSSVTRTAGTALPPALFCGPFKYTL